MSFFPLLQCSIKRSDWRNFLAGTFKEIVYHANCNKIDNQPLIYVCFAGPLSNCHDKEVPKYFLWFLYLTPSLSPYCCWPNDQQSLYRCALGELTKHREWVRGDYSLNNITHDWLRSALTNTETNPSLFSLKEPSKRKRVLMTLKLFAPNWHFANANQANLPSVVVFFSFPFSLFVRSTLAICTLYLHIVDSCPFGLEDNKGRDANIRFDVVYNIPL